MLNHKFRPDVIILANTPLLAASIFRFVNRFSKFILWHQDIFSLAVSMRFNNIKDSQSIAQRFQVRLIQGIEKWLVGSSQQVVCIQMLLFQSIKNGVQTFQK